MHGYHGRVLLVDLATGASTTAPLTAALCRSVIGGVGLGTALLLQYCPAGADPLGPANPLIFATSPFAGSPITTSAKFAVVTRSPLTGMIGDALSSSHLAIDLKRTGFDALVLLGQSPAWSVLVIDDDQVSLYPADDVLGLDTKTTEAELARRFPGRAAVIGPAGERLVRFATISNGDRHAGRAGGGAVMGSKHLKAIIVRGSHDVTVADASGLSQGAAVLGNRASGPATERYRRLGTPAKIVELNQQGALPSLNFQVAGFDGAETLAGEQLHQLRKVATSSCAGCTVGCEHLYRRLDITSSAPTRLEYETMFALGVQLGLSDPDAVIELAHHCDALGLDTISTGGTIAWALESAERGLLPPSDEPIRRLRFGDAGAARELIEAIGARRGLGDVLANGSRLAAEWLGHGSAAWAIHVKGLELPGYDPRSLRTLALGLATTPRGACHNRSGAYDADLGGTNTGVVAHAERAGLAAASEDFAAVLDSLTVCKFIRRCFDDFYGEAANLYQLTTGIPTTADDLRLAGARITTLKKLFNMRQGWTRADDTLPARLLSGPDVDDDRPDDEARPPLDQAELDAMINAYYVVRGCDAQGRPTTATHAHLGLDQLVG